MDEISRSELFAMFKVDVDKISALADDKEELEELLAFVEKNLRAVSEMIDETPSFNTLWEIKNQVLPFTKVSAELEYKQDSYDGNIYKAFTNQLSSDVTFFVWLVLAGSILVARHLSTIQFMFGDRMKEGQDKNWYMSQMTKYYEEVVRPHLENITRFMRNVNFNESDEEQDEYASSLTDNLYSDELKDSVLNLTPIYLQTLDFVFQKISGLYIESIVNNGDDL